jgi:ribosomal protein S4E
LPQELTASHAEQNGDACTVTGDAHAEKTGVVEDRDVSKSGLFTITLRQADDGRFKTVARNVLVGC